MHLYKFFRNILLVARKKVKSIAYIRELSMAFQQREQIMKFIAVYKNVYKVFSRTHIHTYINKCMN